MNKTKLDYGAIFNWWIGKIMIFLIVLRACDVISWPWWRVMAPLWAWLGVVTFGVIAAGVKDFAKRVNDELWDNRQQR